MGSSLFGEGLLALLVLAALPASPLPYPPYQQPYYQPSTYEYTPPYMPPTYTPPTYDYQPATYDYPQTYQPAYPQTYDYQPEYKPSYQPEYKPEYKPAYKPTYEPEYKKEYTPEYDNYDAITYLELNISTKCGVMTATNEDLYGGHNSQVAPFGQQTWTVLITDDYNNMLCQGVVVHQKFVLTAASCVEYHQMDKLRVRHADWDLLSNANEYETWKNFESRICAKWPVTYGSYGYGYSNDYAQLVLLETENWLHYDKYPQILAPICLPTYYPMYTPPTYTPSYPSPAPYSSYQSYPVASPYPSNYNPAPYTPPYTPPYQETYYSECWVMGWYGSKSGQLNNHPRPVAYYDASYGTSYQKQDYSSYQPYTNYDKTLIPKQAKVKEIKCPYGYGDKYGDDAMCVVGVDGFDTCVADKGAAIYCVVPEHYGYTYDSGYSNYDYTPSTYDSYTPQYEQTYPSTPYYGKDSYYKKEIKAKESPAKVERKRGVLVAVVQKFTSCTEYKPSYGYNSYQQQQSKPIVATRITSKTVDFVVNKFWENVMDDSCPAPKSYYTEPTYAPYTPPTYDYPQAQYSYEPQYPMYEAPTYYEPTYNPAPYYGGP